MTTNRFETNRANASLEAPKCTSTSNAAIGGCQLHLTAHLLNFGLPFEASAKIAVGCGQAFEKILIDRFETSIHLVAKRNDDGFRFKIITGADLDSTDCPISIDLTKAAREATELLLQGKAHGTNINLH